MRIGIFTYHFSQNFGAVLQAYALRRWLLDEGHEARLVNYWPRHVEEGGDFRNLLLLSNLRANAKIAYLKLTHARNALFGNREQAQKFADFRRDQIGIVSPPLRRIGELPAATADCGMLVCGSDQIWNPSDQYGLDPAYFLSFGGQGPRRISYAASFGRGALPARYHPEAARLLAGLDAISVREESAVEEVRRIAGREAACVADPTVLLESFESVVQEFPESGEGIFCYALRTGDGIREVAQAASARLGLEVCSPHNPHRRWSEIGRTIYPCPRTWLGALRASPLVVTNSFHGTMFSLLFEKPFVTVAIPGAKGDLNDRSESLLRRVGLEERIARSYSVEETRRILECPVDWERVRVHLAAWREQSREFVRNEIERSEK